MKTQETSNIEHRSGSATGNPNIQVPLGTIGAPAFIPALQKLIAATDEGGKCLLSGREHYWLSKTLGTIRHEVEAYRGAWTSLLKQYGAHSNLDEIRASLGILDDKVKAGTATDAEKESFVGALKKLQQLESTEQLTIFKTDPGYAEFEKEKLELDNQMVALPFSDLIRVPLDKCQTLNAFDMEALGCICEFYELPKQ